MRFMTRRTQLFAGVFILAAVASLVDLHFRESVDDGISKLFNGSRGLAIVENPDRVEMFRVDDPWERITTQPFAIAPPPPGPKIGDRTIMAGPVVLDTVTARSLSAMLSSPQSYSFLGQSTCLFHSDIAVRFVKGNDSFVALFCFHCEQMETFQDGKMIGSQDFRKRSHELFALACKVFPNDKKLQAIIPGRIE